jgi:hypothetical protein
MTVQEIIDLIWSQTEENGTTYPKEVLMGYINLALDDLTIDAKMLDNAPDIPVTVTNAKAVLRIFDTPVLATVHEMVDVFFKPDGGKEERLRKLPSGDIVSRGWVFTSSELQLRNLGLLSGTGSAHLVYYRKFKRVTAPEDVPELPEQYHNMLVLKGCALVQEREASTDLKRDFLYEYTLAKQAFSLQRMWEMEPQHRNLIRQVRAIGGIPGRSS